MTEQTPVKYKRVLLKLSGESLMGPDAFGINRGRFNQRLKILKKLTTWGADRHRCGRR